MDVCTVAIIGMRASHMDVTDSLLSQKLKVLGV